MRGILMSRSTTAGSAGPAVPIRPLAPQVLQRLHAVLDDDHVVGQVVLGQRLEGQLDVLGVVLGQQDAGSQSVIISSPSAWAGEVEGRRLPSSASAQTRPPCRVTMRCTLARPMPVPSNSRGGVQALEHAEQLVRVLHVEAHAVVAHEEDDVSPVLLVRPPTSMRAGACVAGVLDGVAEQVGPHLAQQRAVAAHGRQVADRPTRWCGPPARSRTESALPAASAFMSTPAVHLRAAGPGELQQVVDQQPISRAESATVSR